MKILYVGTERNDAQVVATALRIIDPQVAVAWASRLDQAVRWLDEHPDAAALVVESPVDGGRWSSVLSGVRTLPSHPALVVIVPASTDSTLDSLDPTADDYIPRNESLLKDLPVAVLRAIIRARERHRAEVDQQLAQATAALHDAEQRHRAALTAAEATLADAQVQYEIGMARAAATWDMVDEQLRAAALEVDRARQAQAAAATEVERLTHRDAEISAQLTQASANIADLERRLADADAAVAAARARTEQELRATDERLVERGREFEAQLAEERDRRRSVEDSLAQTSAELADVAASRGDLERRFTATQAAFDDATTRATRDRLAASKRSAEREAELDGQVRRERAARASLEQALTRAEVALKQAEERHEDALSAAANDLAEHQSRFDRELSEAASERARLAGQLNETRTALDQVRHDHASAVADIARLTARETDLTSQLADLHAARQALDVQLGDASAALQRGAARETELADQMQRERATRSSLEQAIAEAEAAARDAQQRHDAESAAAAATLAEHQARFDRELSQLSSDRDRLAARLTDTSAALERLQSDHASATAEIDRLTQRQAHLSSQLDDLRAQHQSLEHQLADTEATLGRVRGDHESAVATIDRLTEREADLVSQLIEVRATRHSLEIQLDDATAALAEEMTTRDEVERTLASTRAEAAERERALQHQAEAIRAEGLEQRAQLEVRIAQERLEQETRSADAEQRHHALSLERDTLQRSLAAAQEQSQQLHTQLTSALQSLEVARRHQELLKAEIEQVPRLRKQIDDHRAESQRLFDQAGLAMFRCAPNGALTQTNRACATLVGRRTLDELPAAQFAAAVFEAPNVLRWLIERCVSTHSKESAETTWRRQDGARLFVRLSARWTPSEIIEVAVEDLTRVRVLQERLGQAHRMEAVGRFAAEVAATCGHLLDDIREQAREWLARATVDAESRQQGEQLIQEVGRAAGLVRQLAEVGDEQVRTPMLVDLNTAIRDLEPVLKRVAGGDVEVQLRDTSSPLMVDVATERVERLLVNLASYGRQCMPAGGHLKIELGTIVVDRHFVAKHPNVRMGVHALITVTQTKRAARGDALRDTSVATRAQGRAAHRPGVDFTTLHGLVNECGGHLWMRVQAQDEMEAKVRLPLVSTHDQLAARPVAVRSGRERLAARLFQS